ncbi:hypothetical protein [Klebsiella pneumoniae]|uniref:hypothetical protein n=1 Tax=Klebsiella pneumoniae TaxID=573 RepID=UPI0015E84F11|nr:hypothetical protein [Klebsiella pneumoniae]
MYELEKPLSNEYTGNELAVIGMAGRFPGAGDIDSYCDLDPPFPDSFCILS